MTARTTVLSAALALVAGAAPALAQATRAPAAAARVSPAVAAAANVITIDDARARLEFISSDFMRGRNTPSPELNIVASYLVSNYRAMGFQPGGEGGTFYQWYPYPLRRLDASAARLQVTGGSGPVELAAGRDFFTAGGTAGELTGPLVYVGRAPDAAMGAGSLQGRIAVAALPGTGNRDWRLERNRLRNAAQRAGASAVVFVLDAPWTADSVTRYATVAARPSRSLGATLAYPQFLLTQEAAGRLFRAAGMDLAQQWQAGSASVVRAGAARRPHRDRRAADAGRRPGARAERRRHPAGERPRAAQRVRGALGAHGPRGRGPAGERRFHLQRRRRRRRRGPPGCWRWRGPSRRCRCGRSGRS